MQRSEVTEITTKLCSLRDARRFILHMAQSRRVLNVGAAGNVEYYLPDRRQLWLHASLEGLAADLVGIDVDIDSVGYANRFGEKLVIANCETMKLTDKFELIVLSEVIEHLDAPGTALKNLIQHLTTEGKIVVTTPNPTHVGIVLRAILGRTLGVYYDHVVAFFPENIKALCARYGYRMSELYFFTPTDERSSLLRIKSAVIRFIGRIVPRLNSSFLAVLEPDSSESGTVV
jgi:2-polyprenyl-3-methyl-5-hydroxy-6-metoxy-1,4-benzoquinol methylase